MDESTWQFVFVVYILLLVATIVFVVMKKTHWSSIIMTGIMPICFLFVLWDALYVHRSRNPGKQGDSGPGEGMSD